MKQLKLCVLAILGFVFTAFAQQKVNDKAVIKTPEVSCDLCKERLERYLARSYGLLSVKIDIKKRTTTIAWLTDRTNIEEIKTTIANAGFDADDVTAEETAYKKLPKECKKLISPAATADSSKN
ncbi:MAG: heavy-metal-associated domain-containing protein [Ferruginibacter sp.]|nr:heavy-metal-associated domain-containing protein [Ferruginibacter sp.]